MSQPAIVSISSHVARGGVGNRAMVFALERLGFTVHAVPTVILAHHPGRGTGPRIVPDDAAFAAMLETLADADVGGIVSGYLATPRQAEAVAALVERAKGRRPDTTYLCDPVIGDGASLYVDAAIAAAIRDRLLPLADAAAPNAFECAWLAGAAPGGDEADLARAAGALPPPVILATSAPALMRGSIGNLLVQPQRIDLIEHPALTTRAKGTGDLLAALLLARRLGGHGWLEAARLAVASVFEMVAATARADLDELGLARFQDALVTPRSQLSIRQVRAP